MFLQTETELLSELQITRRHTTWSREQRRQLGHSIETSAEMVQREGYDVLLMSTDFLTESDKNKFAHSLPCTTSIEYLKTPKRLNRYTRNRRFGAVTYAYRIRKYDIFWRCEGGPK